MNADQVAFNKKWADALASGNYHQGRVKLKAEKLPGMVLHCCLGVACEVAGLKSQVSDSKNTKGKYVFLDGFSGFSLEVPEPMFNELTGFNSDFQRLLMKLNDKKDMDFENIAKLISAHSDLLAHEHGVKESL